MGPGRIRFGVVGLGRTWAARFRPAVQRLRDRFAVSAVLDPVAARAESEARSLRCAAATGLRELVDRPDVDAVALLAPQWFGLHPVELAARAGKPVYLGVPLPDDPAELDRLDAAIRPGGVPVFWESPLRHDPATAALRCVLAERGPAVEVRLMAEVLPYDRSRPPGWFAQDHPVAPTADPGQAAVDWCRLVLGGEVARALLAPAGADPGRTILLDFGREGRATLHLVPWAGDGPDPRPPISVAAVTTARGDGPVRILWPGGIDRGGGPNPAPGEAPPGPPSGEVFLDQFARLLDGRGHSAATWEDALAAARVFAAIGRGAAEGSWVDLDGPAREPRPLPGPPS